jgi:hypothetical protein
MKLLISEVKGGMGGLQKIDGRVFSRTLTIKFTKMTQNFREL